jgi:hypothetical protein
LHLPVLQMLCLRVSRVFLFEAFRVINSGIVYIVMIFSPPPLRFICLGYPTCFLWEARNAKTKPFQSCAMLESP